MKLAAAHCSVALAAASIFCMGGVIFGIASLYPIMFYEHALESSCAAEEQETCAITARPDKCCDNQQVQMTAMSSAALFVADGAMLLYGELADRKGPRVCFGVGMVLAWTGLLLLAMSARANSNAGWYLATVALGGSGPGVFMGCLFLGEKHPELHGVVSAVAASMWDASALVFMLFNTVYFATMTEPSLAVDAVDGMGGAKAGMGLDTLALCWLLACIPIGLATWRTLPSLDQVTASLHAASHKLQGTQHILQLVCTLRDTADQPTARGKCSGRWHGRWV